MCVFSVVMMIYLCSLCYILYITKYFVIHVVCHEKSISSKDSEKKMLNRKKGIQLVA